MARKIHIDAYLGTSGYVVVVDVDDESDVALSTLILQSISMSNNIEYSNNIPSHFNLVMMLLLLLFSDDAVDCCCCCCNTAYHLMNNPAARNKLANKYKSIVQSSLLLFGSANDDTICIIVDLIPSSSLSSLISSLLSKFLISDANDGMAVVNIHDCNIFAACFNVVDAVDVDSVAIICC